MIFNIDDYTRLQLTDQWAIQTRTKVENDTKLRKAGEWSEWASQSYYRDIGICLKHLLRRQIGDLTGEYHRDDLDVLVTGVNRIENNIERALNNLSDAERA